MADTKPRRINYRLRETAVCYGLVIVPMALLVVFVYLPVLWAFTSSLYEFEIGAEARFVGFSHYAEYLTQDPTTWPSLANMLFVTFFGVCTRLTLPLIVAKLIHSLPAERWRYVYRIVFLLPVVVPGVAILLIWGGMIYSDSGLVNETFRALGLDDWVTGWLGDPDTALVAVVMVGFPFAGGFEVLIYYAGLSNIPESVNEAAALEGCVGVRKFFLIDVPMVLSQLKLILVLTVIAGVQTFQNLIILTNGGPGFKTTVPGLWMYFNAFSFQRFGYACAIGVLLFVIIFVLTVLNFKYFKSSEQLQATA